MSQNTRQCTKLRNCELEQSSLPWKYSDLERRPADTNGTFCRLTVSNAQLQVKINKDEHLTAHFIQSQGQTENGCIALACIPEAERLPGKMWPLHIKYDRQSPAKDSHIKPDIMIPRCGMSSALAVAEPPIRDSFVLAECVQTLCCFQQEDAF